MPEVRPLYEAFLRDEIPASDLPEPEFGPLGRDVYRRTYSRQIYQVDPEGRTIIQDGKPQPHDWWVWRTPYEWGDHDRTCEVWAETCRRVAHHNLRYVDPLAEPDPDELLSLFTHMYEMRILPGGRHLSNTGVSAAVRNCFRAGFSDKPSDHFRFLALRLFEGGGVGANYSSAYLDAAPPVRNPVKVRITCRSDHPDHSALSHLLTPAEQIGAGCEAHVVPDTREGWVEALCTLVDRAFEDGPRELVFDLSEIRPHGAPLRRFGGTASGPLALADLLVGTAETLSRCAGRKLDPIDYMEVDHLIARSVVAGGHRRSARMSMLSWSDPHIFRFCELKTSYPEPTPLLYEAAATGNPVASLLAGRFRGWEEKGVREKQEDDLTAALHRAGHPDHHHLLEGERRAWLYRETPHWTTNISVEWDADGVAALVDRSHPGHEHAVRVLSAMTAGMHRNGEPGVYNSWLAGRHEQGDVRCTNPCGEIPLEADPPNVSTHRGAGESCNIGSVNLAFCKDAGQALEAHRLLTRFLVRATMIVQSEDGAEFEQRNRRIGVGIMGLQEWAANRGVRWSRIPDSPSLLADLADMRRAAREEADRYTRELGIPAPVKVTAIAPTGTISLLPGVTPGIHPVLAKRFIRRVQFSNTDPVLAELRDRWPHEPSVYAANTTVVEIPVTDTILTRVPEHLVEEIGDLPLDVQLRTVLAVQESYLADGDGNSLSFTGNLSNGDSLFDTLLLYIPLLKGFTVLPPRSYVQAPVERIDEEEYRRRMNGQGRKPVVYGSADEDGCRSGACPVV